MYCDFFGLRCRPFEDRADARFYYPTAESDELLTALEYESRQGQQKTLVLGETGTGKTLLIRALLQRLHATDHAVVLTWSANSESSLIRETCKRFGVTLPDSYNEERCLARLRRRLRQIREADHHAILIIDQAENLSGENIAELSTLIGVLKDQRRLLRIILVAHPQFRDALDQPAMADLRQQFCGAHTIPALSASDTEAYIIHRLRIAGAGDAELFEPGAIDIIHAASGGIARRINQMADAGLLAAHASGVNRVTRAIAVKVQQQLNSDEGEIDAGARAATPVAEPIRRATAELANRESLEPRLVESILAICQDRIKEQVAAQVRVHKQTIEAEIAKYRARIGALIETSTANVPAIRHIQELIANALQVNEALQGAVAHADSKIGQMNSHHAAAASVLRRLGEATVAGHDRAEELTGAVSSVEHTITSGQQIVKDVWETTSRTETNMRTLTATNKKAIELITSLGDITETARQTVAQLDERTTEAARCLDGIRSQLTNAGEIVERLGAVQGVCNVMADAETSINETTERAVEVCRKLADATQNALTCGESLSQINAEAHRLIESTEQMKQDAGASIEQLATQVSTARRVIEKSSPLLHELITRSRQVHDQIDGLQRRADEIERSVATATVKPTEIVAAAQEQASQLERVVAAVQKVFGMLSKASLDAGSKVSEFRRASDVAQRKLGQLTDDTARAARTLQMWVEEAVRIQARMERTIQATPSIGETHSGEVLRQVSRSIEAMGHPAHAGTSGELSVLREPRATPAPGATAPTTGRAGEVTQIIENARKAGGSQ